MNMDDFDICAFTKEELEEQFDIKINFNHTPSCREDVNLRGNSRLDKVPDIAGATSYDLL